MKRGFWGYAKGSLILHFKALPRVMLAPLIGALRGAVRGGMLSISEEVKKCEARIAAFQEQYLKEREEEIAQMSKGPSTMS
jgi:hypothetical protein